MIHREISVASIYKDSGIKDKSLIAHIACLWVMKASMQRTCHLCDLIVRDILKHLVCDCISKRALVNLLLESIQFKVGIDAFIELAFCSKEERVIKMLSLVLETDISLDQFAFLANKRVVPILVSLY